MSRFDDPRARLSKVLPLLGSDQPGERDTAALAATWILLNAGLSWDCVLGPEPPEHHEPLLGTWPNDHAELGKHHQGSFRPWERGFVADVPKFLIIPTEQRCALKEIALRVLGDQ